MEKFVNQLQLGPLLIEHAPVSPCVFNRCQKYPRRKQEKNNSPNNQIKHVNICCFSECEEQKHRRNNGELIHKGSRIG